jgi:predicted hotdog family 3-hydroxylacyl-ACP dehydratase
MSLSIIYCGGASMNKVAALIPHSGKVELLDRIVVYDDQSLTAELVVRGGGLLGADESVPALASVEFMAQTIAAYLSAMAVQADQPACQGFLLGTRRYNSNVTAFTEGSKLMIRVEKIKQDEGLVVFDCRIDGEGLEITATLNVYQPPAIT